MTTNGRTQPWATPRPPAATHPRRARTRSRSSHRSIPGITNGGWLAETGGTVGAPPARFYFATPHHAWERGTNENTNGLLRQYLPKRQSMHDLTQHDCNRIARKLNQRPRKCLGYRTPGQCYVP